MSARELATRLAVLMAAEERLSTARVACRRALDEALDQDASKGSYVMLGGEQIGEVVRVKGRVTAKVTDPAALLEWVRENHPTEVQHVERIRPAFEARLIVNARSDGAPVDQQGTYIPGITVTTGDPTIRYTPTEGAAAAVERAWQAGVIDLRDLLALPGGE